MNHLYRALLLLCLLLFAGCTSTSAVGPLHFYQGDKHSISELSLLIATEVPGEFFTTVRESASFVSIDSKDLANDFVKQNPTQVYILPGVHEIEVMYGNNFLFIYSLANQIAPKYTIKADFKKGETYLLRWAPIKWGEEMEFWLEDRSGNKYLQNPSK